MVDDNCNTSTISYALEGATAGNGLNDASGTSFNKGITTVWYKVTDPSNNEDSCSFDVTVLTTIVPPDSAYADRDSICPGVGSIQLMYSGGVMVEEGTAVWYDDAGLTNTIGAGNSLNIPAPMAETNYFVRFEGNCDTSSAVGFTLFVKVPSVAPDSAIADRNNICAGDGLITLYYTGGFLGTGALARWYTDASMTSSIGSGNNLSVSAPDMSMTYYVRFEGGCDTTSAVSVMVNVFSIPVPSFTEKADAACINSPLYRYIASGQVGSVFTWNITNGTIRYGNNDTILVDWGANAITGILRLTETSVDGCTSVPVVQEVEVRGPALELGEDVETCVGLPVTIIPEGDFTSYLWHDGTTGSDYTTLIEGLIGVLVEDEFGCVAEDSIYLTVHPLPEVDLGSDTSLCGDIGVVLSAGTDGILYRWSTGDNSKDITVYQGEKKEIRVEVEDEFGCISMDTVVIDECNAEFYFRDMPTAITPNNDGKNDFWVIDKLASYTQAEVEIFSRWGTLVWKSEPGYSIPWDGTDMGGNEVPMDSYHFVIKLNVGSIDQITGIITVIR